MTEESSTRPSAFRSQTPWRYWAIAALLFLAAAVNYVDRQTLSILKPQIKTTLGTDDAGYALLVNLFTFCYAGAYIGSGWVVDRIGAKRSLVLFITVWSLATTGCGFAPNFLLFGIFRALLGLAEPGNQPVAIRALTLWTPPERRGLMMSLVGAGSTMGSIVSAPLIAWLASDLGWHAAFILPGIVGLCIGAAWWMVYQHPPLSEKTEDGESKMENSQAAPASLPWPQLWRQRSLWGIVLARLVSDPVWYFCLFWMPGYFQEQKGLTLEQAGHVGWIPFFAASVGGITMAAVSDQVGRRMGSHLRARMLVLGILALLGPAVMFVPRVPELWMTVALLCVVAVVCLAWLSILGPLVADVFPAGNVASVWSIAGAFGALGAIVFNHQIGKISSTVGTNQMFLILGCLHLLAAGVLFVLVRKVEHRQQSQTDQ